MRHLDIGRKKVRGREKRAHVTVEMSGMDSDGERALHLGANFLLRLGRFGLRRDFLGGGIERPIRLQQT